MSPSGEHGGVRRLAPTLLVLLVACSGEDLRVANRLAQGVSVDVHAPKLGIGPNCAEDFATRFCEEEYEAIGVLDFPGQEQQTVVVEEGTGGDDCANILWLRVLSVDELGPVVDLGTLIQVPTDVEIEVGSGLHHTVAFPNLTLKIDEVGLEDLNQSGPPKSCAELGRDPRG